MADTVEARLTRERAAAWDQADRERRRADDLANGLRWIAGQMCQHTEQSICLPCYARTVLRNHEAGTRGS